MRPLSLTLADAAVQDVFLHTLDCEVTSVCGSIRLRVMRPRETGERVFLCIDRTATHDPIDSVMLDKAQAAYLRAGIVKAVGSLKIGHSVVLRGVQFAVREANAVAKSLAEFLEE